MGQTIDVYFRVRTTAVLTGDPDAADWPGCGIPVQVLERISDPCVTPVTIEDQSGPNIIQCAPDVVFDCHDVPASLTPANVSAAAGVAQVFPDYVDNCDNIDITFTDAISGSIGPNCYVIERTWTVTDLNNGLTATCIQTITIEDNSAPYFTGIHAPEIWINEIGWDDPGFDNEEFVEIAGTAGFDLTGWSLYFYVDNPGPDNFFKVIPLDGWIPNEAFGFGTVLVDADPGGPGDDIDNPDGGIALVDPNGDVEQLWSYPTTNTFTTDNGPAAGLTTTSIGTGATDNGAAGTSVQLIDGGTGNAGNLATTALGGVAPHAGLWNWSGPLPESPGSLNIGQTIPNWWAPLDEVTIQCGDAIPAFWPGAADNCDIIVDVTLFDSVSTQGLGGSCSNYNYLITRTYHAEDNCLNISSGTHRVFVQDTVAPVIVSIHPVVSPVKVSDNPGASPDIDGYEADQTLILAPVQGDCDPDLILTPVIMDCAVLADMNIQYELRNAATNALVFGPAPYGGGNIVIANLVQGTDYVFNMSANDACNNISTFTMDISVILSKPTAICSDITVNLDQNGVTSFTALDVNQDQSHDECYCLNNPIQCTMILAAGTAAPGTITGQISWDGINYSNTLPVDCNDIGQTLQVTMLVTNEIGETNTCTSGVTIFQGQADFNFTFNVTDASSPVTADGAITANVDPFNPGNNDFDFEWSNGSSSMGGITSSISSLLPGMYMVTITDRVSGCAEVYNVTVGVSSAVVLKAGTTGGGVGATVTIPVTVDNFLSIAGFNFTMHMDDPVVGDFAAVKNINPVIASLIVPPPGNFPNDVFSVAWSNAAVINLGPGTVLFDVCITLTGGIGDDSDVTFSAVDFVNGAANSVGSTTVPGNVSITGGLPIITGLIHTPYNNNPIANVKVDISGSVPNASQTTGAAGQYSFIVPFGSNATLDPDIITDSDNAWITGIDIGDPVIIKQYLAALTAIDAIQMIAADVNGDGFVGIGDAVLLEQLLALIITDVIGVESWVFVADDAVLAAPPNTLTSGFPEMRNYPNVIGNINDAGFSSIKRGDMNNTIESLVLNAPLDNGNPSGNNNTSFTFPRNGNSVDLIATNDKIATGETFEVTMKFENPTDINGVMFTLDFDSDKLELNEIVPGQVQGMNPNSFGYVMQDKGQIAVVWANGITQSMKASDEMMTVVFKAKTAIDELEDVLAVNSSLVQAMAYTGSGEYVDVHLSFVDPLQSLDSYILFENRPNPFSHETTVQFVLPVETDATFSIMDLSGKVIYQSEARYQKGVHQIKVDAQVLNQTGILYYQLETPEFSATKKMVRTLK